ncbi:MAG: phosphoribosyltransferase family protein [Nitrososphaeria archaeon]|jgi:hypoxanthine phosphoribosyltransferase|nr:phosphoribosyltransferase [Nitrososphaerota archaeon]
MEKRLISWRDLGLLTKALVDKVKKGERPDVVVGIARGGLIPAMVIADRLRAPLDIINIKSYRALGVKGVLKVYDVMYEDVADKKVLIVDDVADTGETFLFVSEHMMKKGAKSVMLASIFLKPWSRVRPNYFVEETDEWIVFPWELGEFEMLDREELLF